MVMERNEASWRERLDEVKAIHRALAERPGTPVLVEKLAAFVNDPKWEIRKVVAEAMLYVPQSKQFQFTSLCNDKTSYVKVAAEASLARSGVVIGDDGRSGENLMLAATQKIDKLMDKAKGKADKKTAAQVEAAFQAQYEITVGAVGHEIRNLLSPMQSSLAKAMKILSLPASSRSRELEALKYLQEASGRAKAMEAMANDIRTLVKKTNEKKCHENLLFLLNDALATVQDMFRGREMDIDGIDVKVIADDKISCYVAREAIMHTFRNLIKNAYESFQTGENTFEASGNIIIEARSVNGGVQITFSDTGMGMNKEELTIVRRFTANGTSKKASGTGFGLAIACRKVRDHEGTITIDSEEDKGTTVTVFLPDKGVADV